MELMQRQGTLAGQAAAAAATAEPDRSSRHEDSQASDASAAGVSFTAALLHMLGECLGYAKFPGVRA